MIKRNDRSVPLFFCKLEVEQLDTAFLMVEFTFNHFRNATISYNLFELNYGYHLQVFFKDEYNTRLQFSLVNRLAIELRELINTYHQNLLHAQNF